MGRNWGKACKLTVEGAGVSLDLSNMRIRFFVNQATLQSMHTAEIRVYNLSPATAKKLKNAKHGAKVTLDAGYVDNIGNIAWGELYWPQVGRETPTDTFADLYIKDGYRAYNYATNNTTLKSGSTGIDIYNECLKAMKQFDISQGDIPQQALQKLKYSRSITMFGNTKDFLRTLAHSVNAQWYIDRGKLHMPVNGDTKTNGEAITLNSHTGMIGMPTQTPDGIIVTAQINPAFKVGGQVKINESDIVRASPDLNRTTADISRQVLEQTGVEDGTYKIIGIEWEGDSRGNPWYAILRCIGAVTGVAGTSQQMNIVE